MLPRSPVLGDFLLKYYLLLSAAFLAGCNAGSGSTPSDMTAPTPVSPPTGTDTTSVPTPAARGATYATGTVSGATTAASGSDPISGLVLDNGTIYPRTVTINGVERDLTANSDLTFISTGTSTFSFIEGADGASFAMIGLPGSNAGSYLSAATPAPTSGTASLSGRYFGRHNGAPITVGNPFITGTANLNVDFTGNTFTGSITGRNTITGTSTVSATQMNEDVTFSGTIDANGVLLGSHADANSSAAVAAVAYDSGAVGTLDLMHTGAKITFNGDGTVRETGVFEAR